MEFPDPLKTVGAQIEAGGEIAPPPEFFEAYDVFSAELTNLLVQPWLAVDHASRLAEDGNYFRAELGSRSVMFVRESAEQIHAMRNACLHAGYRVCEEESGRGDHLFCQYHGWYYALDGRLTDPLLRPEQTDRSRFRLPRYAMRIDRGLIFVDMSKAGPAPPEAGAIDTDVLPGHLADAIVTGRDRVQTTLNWKHLRPWLWEQPDLVFAEPGFDGVAEFGPTSYVAWQGEKAALVRLAPRFPGHSDIVVIRLAPPDNSSAESDGARLAAALRDAPPTGPLGRRFYDWYWSALTAAAA